MGLSDLWDSEDRQTIEPKIKIHEVELYKDFVCECGVSDWNVFESKHKFSMVCKSCNFKLFIGMPVYESD